MQEYLRSEKINIKKKKILFKGTAVECSGLQLKGSELQWNSLISNPEAVGETRP